MLTVHHISKSFGVETILDDIVFSLNPGERAGLVGPNGCGKTTLLNILAGVDKPDSGTFQLSPPSLRVGYLPQGLNCDEGESLETFLRRGRDDVQALAAQIESLAAELAAAPDRAELQRDYDRALARMADASSEAGQVLAVLSALGLEGLPPSLPVMALSGGQKTRLALAALLLSNPHLLLLDEPTNHLDIAMLEWLESWLGAFQGAALIVSHDRTFLDRSVTRILELDPLTHRLREYTGTYSDYVEQKEAERARQWEQWRDQQQEIRRLKQDIIRAKAQAARTERQASSVRIGGRDMKSPGAKDYQQTIAKKVAKKAKAREKKLERYIESDERLDKPRQSWQMKLDFGETRACGKDVLALEGLSVGYGEHILLANLNVQVRQGARVAITGPNGEGKTTLLRTITGSLPPLAGRVRLGANVSLGYMAQDQAESLDPELDAFATIRGLVAMSDTDVRSFLHFFLFGGDDVFVPVGSLSYGERARLSLACLVAQGCNVLLLDEPINHLDIPSRSRFEQALVAFEGTVLAVVHDRYFIERFAGELWKVEAGTLTKSWR
jgi:ATP-binding cassette subfamily F protein 3